MSTVSLAEKAELNPADDLFFAGFILQGTEQEIKKIKQFILTETSAKLIYQRKGIPYLKIEAVKTTS